MSTAIKEGLEKRIENLDVGMTQLDTIIKQNEQQIIECQNKIAEARANAHATAGARQECVVWLEMVKAELAAEEAKAAEEVVAEDLGESPPFDPTVLQPAKPLAGEA